jgi:hypothetical protein
MRLEVKTCAIDERNVIVEKVSAVYGVFELKDNLVRGWILG